MRIVLDTNVVVSGLLTPFGASAQIIRMVASGHLVLCYDVPDRDDQPFLEVAVAANIETPDEPVPLVTGNSDHYRT